MCKPYYRAYSQYNFAICSIKEYVNWNIYLFDTCSLYRMVVCKHHKLNLYRCAFVTLSNETRQAQPAKIIEQQQSKKKRKQQKKKY